MTVEDLENEVLSKIDLETENPLHLLQKAIANMPNVDKNKVNSAIAKLNAGDLEILGNRQEKLASAKRIVSKIMAENGIVDEDTAP